MSEEMGVFTTPTEPCSHPACIHLTTCSVCPVCESFTAKTLDLTACYRELLGEIINVQDFGSVDARYLTALDKAASYIEAAQKK